jgi:hypothetical protein
MQLICVGCLCHSQPLQSEARELTSGNAKVGCAALRRHSSPGAAVVANGQSATREGRLLSWADEISALVATQRDDLRRSRMELVAAQEVLQSMTGGVQGTIWVREHASIAWTRSCRDARL